MKDVLAFLDLVPQAFDKVLTDYARWCNRLFTSIGRLPEKVIAKAFRSLMNECRYCRYGEWRWQKHTCFVAAEKKYPRFLYEEVWGCQDYDTLFPPSDFEQTCQSLHHALKRLALVAKTNQPQGLYRYD